MERTYVPGSEAATDEVEQTQVTATKQPIQPLLHRYCGKQEESRNPLQDSATPRRFQPPLSVSSPI